MWSGIVGSVCKSLSFVCVCAYRACVSGWGSSQLSPRSICDQTPAEIKNTWELFWSSLIAGWKSKFPPRLLAVSFQPSAHPSSYPLCLELFARNRQHQSTSKFPFGKEKNNQNKQMMRKERRKTRNNVCVHRSDGRANAVPTVLWLANLEVPDLQLSEGRKKNRAGATGCRTVR